MDCGKTQQKLLANVYEHNVLNEKSTIFFQKSSLFVEFFRYFSFFFLKKIEKTKITFLKNEFFKRLILRLPTHPNIVQVYGVCKTLDENLVLVMEYLVSFDNYFVFFRKWNLIFIFSGLNRSMAIYSRRWEEIQWMLWIIIRKNSLWLNCCCLLKMFVKEWWDFESFFFNYRNELKYFIIIELGSFDNSWNCS